MQLAHGCHRPMARLSAARGDTERCVVGGKSAAFCVCSVSVCVCVSVCRGCDQDQNIEIGSSKRDRLGNNLHINRVGTGDWRKCMFLQTSIGVCICVWLAAVVEEPAVKPICDFFIPL